MQISNYKTIDLKEKDIEMYLSSFNYVFEMNRTADEFKNMYLNTCLGYSFHTLYYDDAEKLCGGYTLVPFSYEVKGEKMIFAVGTDMFISEQYREDVGNIINVLNASIKNAKANGIVGCFGFPNDNSNNVSRAFLKEKRIGLLDTYILPYKVGDYKSSFKPLNIFSKLFSNCLLEVSKLSDDKKLVEYPIKKSRPEFDETRWNWFKHEDYHHYDEENLHATWRITQFEGIKACFLIDLYPMSKYNFDKSVREMVKQERRNAGLFLYVGHLNFTPASMIKIPRKFEPKTFRFDFRILDKEKLSKEVVYTLDNWEVNLSSYDLL